MEKTPSENFKFKLAFFGTSDFSVSVLNGLKIRGIIPALLITSPDKPQGRKLELTPPPPKIWADENHIEVVQESNLKNPDFIKRLEAGNFDVFLVASYGKIIPEKILGIPKRRTLNIHPSLLPKFRGPSPIQTAILNDEKENGVTIMVLDKEMDHGGIIASQKVNFENWPPKTSEMKKILAETGAELFSKITKDWVTGRLEEIPQDHSKATYTKKIEKKDGEINLSGDAYANFLKIQAMSDWPGAFFFTNHRGKKIRVIVKEASYKNGVLEIQRVVPEGKKEMSYADFLRGFKD